MSFFRVFILMILACTSASAIADSFKVKNCDADAAADITEAYRFVSNNLDAVFDPMTFLTSNQRDRMKKKWDRLTANCRDDTRKCVNHQTISGFAHGGLGNEVNVCYYTMVSEGYSLCKAVEVLVHEEGHANGVPHMDQHNHLTQNIFDNDLVYRMGRTARAFCEAESSAGRFSDVILRGISNRSLADSCSKDAQCSSGRCEKGECVCKQDSDCANGHKCRRPLGGINQCRP